MKKITKKATAKKAATKKTGTLAPEVHLAADSNASLSAKGELSAATAAPMASAKPAAKKAGAKKAAKATRANGKGAAILALIQRNGGATAGELQQATGWQPHSVRGFLSTAKKRGTKIASAKREDGQRVYSLQAYAPTPAAARNEADGTNPIGFFRCGVDCASPPSDEWCRMKRMKNAKPADATPGFAIKITEVMDLGLAMLIAEDEEGHYQPVAAARHDQRSARDRAERLGRADAQA